MRRLCVFALGEDVFASFFIFILFNWNCLDYKSYHIMKYMRKKSDNFYVPGRGQFGSRVTFEIFFFFYFRLPIDHWSLFFFHCFKKVKCQDKIHLKRARLVQYYLIIFTMILMYIIYVKYIYIYVKLRKYIYFCLYIL